MGFIFGRRKKELKQEIKTLKEDRERLTERIEALIFMVENKNKDIDFLNDMVSKYKSKYMMERYGRIL